MSDHSHSERERSPLTRRTPTNDASAADPGTTPHPMLALQRQLGNAHIARMLAQREEMPEHEEEEIQAKHDSSVAQRDELPEEEEEQLQAMHDPSIAQRETPEEDELQAMHDPSIQRHGSEDELQAKHDLTQRHGSEDELQASPEVGLEGGPVSDGIADKINSARGGGAPLDSGMRESMESSFGTSFEGVRVHSGGESASLNRSISAKAFTTGNDIFLGQGASSGDQSLMAHELTHVVQQRSMSSSGGMSVGPAGDSYEQEADSAASAISAGQPAPQRKPEEK